MHGDKRRSRGTSTIAPPTSADWLTNAPDADLAPSAQRRQVRAAAVRVGGRATVGTRRDRADGTAHASALGGDAGGRAADLPLDTCGGRRGADRSFRAALAPTAPAWFVAALAVAAVDLSPGAARVRCLAAAGLDCFRAHLVLCAALPAADGTSSGAATLALDALLFRTATFALAGFLVLPATDAGRLRSAVLIGAAALLAAALVLPGRALRAALGGTQVRGLAAVRRGCRAAFVGLRAAMNLAPLVAAFRDLAPAEPQGVAAAAAHLAYSEAHRRACAVTAPVGPVEGLTTVVDAGDREPAGDIPGGGAAHRRLCSCSSGSQAAQRRPQNRRAEEAKGAPTGHRRRQRTGKVV